VEDRVEGMRDGREDLIGEGVLRWFPWRFI
jgi:hypothetical protein